jgi:hypothetical protein
MKWTKKDEQVCFTNGWAIFGYNGDNIIMKIDDIYAYREGSTALIGIKNKRHFKTDDAAYNFVQKQAHEGCQTSRKALRMCPKQSAYLEGII